MSLIFLPMISLPRPFWADTKLWVPFGGNSSADIGPYGIGSGTNNAATITGNLFSLSGTGAQNIVYGPSSNFGRSAGQPWTLEAFINWTSSANSTQPGDFFTYDCNATTYPLTFGIYANLGKVVFNCPEFGTPDAGPSASNVLASGMVHVAMVRPSGSGAQTMRFYVNGAQVFTFLETSERTNSVGTITIGKTTSSVASVYTIDDVRFTRAALYTGASFTPPTSPL